MPDLYANEVAPPMYGEIDRDALDLTGVAYAEGDEFGREEFHDVLRGEREVGILE